ncbi:MAG TPA: TolC family protein [Candidatus Acidoferrales bacterium]|nr:TolC family protein [Candidatus Acidoferrales bacterium]
MPFARFASITRLAAVGVFSSALTLTCWAQEAPAAPTPQNTPEAKPVPALDYSRPEAHFPNPFAPYTPRHVAPPNLANTSRIDSLMRDGKLYLSLDDAIALALENNLDIAISRYNLNIADTDVLRAKAGAQILGVNLGIVQNTPGGGVGGIGSQVGSGTGGTTLGAGGAGAGAGGIVSSTSGGLFGPLITSFDPVITGTFQSDHASFIPTSPFQGSFQGTTTANFSYLQGFQWGTNLQVGFNNTRISSNSAFQSVSPALNSSFQFRLTQHLLQGFGFAPNTRFIRIAKNNRELSDVAFRLQVITTVDQIENMYWDLVYAYENQRVKEESLAFSQKTLSDTKKQVEIGSLAPIEAVRAQSTVAADEQALTVAKTNLQLQQLIMKNALSRTLHDPVLANAAVIPTSTMEVPANQEIQPTEDLVNEALSHRAELVEQRISLNSQQISNKALRSGLLPTLDAYAYYGGSGLGGAQNPASICQSPDQQYCATASPDPTLGQFPLAASVSYPSTLNQLVNSTAPDKGVGLQLNIPIRNRASQALQIRGELEYRQAQMSLQQTENRVSIEVRQAQFSVEQNRASVAAAKAAVDYAKQSLDAEQKKYQFGTSTTTAVLQNRSALATSESTLLSAMAAYEKARVELDRAVGNLLDHDGISIDDAARGQVMHLPNVPYVAPRTDVNSLTGTPIEQPQQQQ